jgi:hypothetical protein
LGSKVNRSLPAAFPHYPSEDPAMKHKPMSSLAALLPGIGDHFDRRRDRRH